MLTKKENVLETIRGGNPDRFVNQFEAFATIRANPFHTARCTRGGGPVVDEWGVTRIWDEDNPAAFPIHDEAHIIIKDIEHWRDYVRKPDYASLTPADWESTIAEFEKVDKNEQFPLAFIAPGLFEQCHYLMEIKNALIAFIEYPDEMHELIDYLTEAELEMAEQWCTYLKPEGVFHHDDWGTQISTFLSPDMFAEFFLEPYRRIYGFWRDHGATMIVHHSDSFATTLVPYMIDMGITVWQGAMTTNDIAALVETYGDKITFMGGIDNGKVDKPDWSKEEVEQAVRKACTEYGKSKKAFIPCLVAGGVGSTYDGVYDYASECIDQMSKEMF